MDHRRLGGSGLTVSRLTLGTMGFGDPAWRSWVLAEEESKPILRRALDLGITLIDSCDNYSKGASEALLGRLFRGFVDRDEILLATKFGLPQGRHPHQKGYSRHHVIAACEASLRRLGTDRIDILQTHIWDPASNVEEMAAALDHLVASGKVLYVGATDMPTWQFAKAVYHARHRGLAPFVSMQSHYNLVWREDERELFDFCRAEGIGVMPYSPMARGFLCGRARRLERTTERARTDDFAEAWYGRPADAAVAEAVEDAAAELGIPPAQLALAWVLRNPAVDATVIGPTRPEHLDEAVAALSIELDEAVVKRLEAPYLPRMKNRHG